MDTANFLDYETIEMPFSLEAEQAVLGCVLLDPGCMPHLASFLHTEHFYLPRHQAIYAAMLSLETMGGKIDPLLVLDILKRDKVFDEEGGKNYLFQLAQLIPSTANVEGYVKIVREKYYMRALITASKETIERTAGQEDSAENLLESAEQRLYAIRQGRSTSEPSRLNDIIINEVYDHLSKISSPDRDAYMGISTGYKDLDDVINGLNKTDLILIGARPSMGKTSVALNLARNVALLGKKVLFFSLEMTKMQLAQHVWFSHARVQIDKIRSGKLDRGDWESLGKAVTEFNNCELYFDDNSNIKVSEMKARVRRMKNVDCVFIDYLGLLTGETRAQNRVQEVTELTRALKLMAKDLEIPVVCCAQLSRETEKGGKSRRPQLADLRDSGSIEQDADIVMMLFRENYNAGDPTEIDEDNPPKTDEMEINVVKNRHGATRMVKFRWEAEYTLLTQLARDDYDY